MVFNAARAFSRVLTPAGTLGYNVASDPPRFARVAEMLGANTSGMSTRKAADEARDGFVWLQRDLGVPPSGLNDLAGITADDTGALTATADRICTA